MKKILLNNKYESILLIIAAIYSAFKSYFNFNTYLIVELVVWFLFFFLFPVIVYLFSKSEKAFRYTAIVILALWFISEPLNDFLN
jgi:hypothetical protein